MSYNGKILIGITTVIIVVTVILIALFYRPAPKKPVNTLPPVSNVQPVTTQQPVATQQSVATQQPVTQQPITTTQQPVNNPIYIQPESPSNTLLSVDNTPVPTALDYPPCTLIKPHLGAISQNLATWTDGTRNTAITILYNATQLPVSTLQAMPNSELLKILNMDCVKLRANGDFVSLLSVDPRSWTDGQRNTMITIFYNVTSIGVGILQGMTNNMLYMLAGGKL